MQNSINTDFPFPSVIPCFIERNRPKKITAPNHGTKSGEDLYRNWRREFSFPLFTTHASGGFGQQRRSAVGWIPSRHAKRGVVCVDIE